MKKNKIWESIEEGLLDYYLSIDYSLPINEAVSEEVSSYGTGNDKYKKLAKRILFKAKIATKKSIQTKVISISEASGKLTALDKELEGNVFPIFKKHIEKYGLAANYRNFDSITKEEMINILKQLNLTFLFDEIESKLKDE